MKAHRSGDEQLEVVPRVFVFDIDGVITDPREKVIKEPELLRHILRLLEAGEPVALATGRALKWVMEIVVKPILSATNDPDILNNLFVSGEFGAAYVVFENGEAKHFVEKQMSLPQNVADQVKQIATNEFSDVSFVDPDKETMVSIEMKKGMTVEEFRSRQAELTSRLQTLLDEAGLNDEFEVHVDRIATNVRDKSSNKRNSVRQVRKWLSDRKIKTNTYLVFGDSESDLEMGHELQDLGENVKFIFVGGKENLSVHDTPFEIEFTSEQCAKGTLEYLTLRQ